MPTLLDRLWSLYPMRLRSGGVESQVELLDATAPEPQSGLRLQLRVASFEGEDLRDMREQAIDLPRERYEGRVATERDVEAYLDALPVWAEALAAVGDLDGRMPADFLICPYERETPEVPARGVTLERYRAAIAEALARRQAQSDAAVQALRASPAAGLVGRPAEVKQGPFAGMAGKVAEIVPPGRLRLVIETFGRESTIDLTAGELTGEPVAVPEVERLDDLFIGALGLREPVPPGSQADYQTHARLVGEHLSRPDAGDRRRSDVSGAIDALAAIAGPLRTNRRRAQLLGYDPLASLDGYSTWLAEAIPRMTGPRKTRNPIRVALHRIHPGGTIDVALYAEKLELAPDAATADEYFAAHAPYDLPQPFWKLTDLGTLRIDDDRIEDPVARWVAHHLLVAKLMLLVQRGAERVRDRDGFATLNDGKPLWHLACVVGRPRHWRLLAP